MNDTRTSERPSCSTSKRSISKSSAERAMVPASNLNVSDGSHQQRLNRRQHSRGGIVTRVEDITYCVLRSYEPRPEGA